MLREGLHHAGCEPRCFSPRLTESEESQDCSARQCGSLGSAGIVMVALSRFVHELFDQVFHALGPQAVTTFARMQRIGHDILGESACLVEEARA